MEKEGELMSVSAIRSQNTYMLLASGSGINRASDDAAEISHLCYKIKGEC